MWEDKCLSKKNVGDKKEELLSYCPLDSQKKKKKKKVKQRIIPCICMYILPLTAVSMYAEHDG